MDRIYFWHYLEDFHQLRPQTWEQTRGEKNLWTSVRPHIGIENSLLLTLLRKKIATFYNLSIVISFEIHFKTIDRYGID